MLKPIGRVLCEVESFLNLLHPVFRTLFCVAKFFLKLRLLDEQASLLFGEFVVCDEIAKPYGGAGLTSPSLDEWAIDKIAELTTADEITHEVLEIYIKGEGDRDAILAFIKKLANRMRSEFGLNLS